MDSDDQLDMGASSEESANAEDAKAEVTKR